MKRSFVLSLILSAGLFLSVSLVQVGAQDLSPAPDAATASLFTEDFNYPPGDLITSHGWSPHSGTGTNSMVVNTPGLTYAGHPGSGVGSALFVGDAGGEDVNNTLSADQNANGTTIYFSFLVNVNEASASKVGDYFIHIGNRTDPSTFTLFAARVFARVVNGNVNFGLSNTSTATWGTTNFNKNQTYLIVVKYTIDNTGADPTSMWVFSSGIPASEAAAGTPEVVNTTTTGQDDINAIGIRQGSSQNQPSEIVDGIRIANTWAELFAAASAGHVQHVADYNGDGKTDYTIFRGGAGASAVATFWTRFNGGTPATDTARDFGITSDTVITADFDGDTKTDVAIWRQGSGRTSAYWVLGSSDNTVRVYPFGQAGDDPTMAADYTGDGKADPAIYRTSTGQFWYQPSSGPLVGQQVIVPFGQNGDIAIPGDYDGDGKADFTIYRAANPAPDKTAIVWTMFNPGDGSAGAVIARQFGTTDDFFTPGDYDGDGKTDLCVNRLSGGSILWIYRPSNGGADQWRAWGAANDYVVPGDYDGDGTTDLAIYRDDPGQFWVQKSTDQTAVVTSWGQLGDFPVNASGY